MEELQSCDSLIVMCGTGGEIPLQLAIIAGFALARGLRVIWIGSPVRTLNDFRVVQHFRTVEEFRKELLKQTHSRWLPATDKRLAA
jgi:hypothetical protein